MENRTGLRTSFRRASWLALLVAAALVTPLGSSAAPAARLASDPPQTMQYAPQAAGKHFEFTGKIVSVDYAANMLVVRSRGEEHSISITPTTSIEHAGQPGGISDLRPGVRIHVTGAARNGVLIADSIEIRTDGPHGGDLP